MLNDIERNFLYIMDTYGHDVLVVHADRKKPCSCYHKPTGSANRNCLYCFGLGFVATVTKQRTRKIEETLVTSNASDISLEKFGGVIVPRKSYYFYKDVAVSAQDLIVEVDWVNNQPVYNGGVIMEVQNVSDNRYLNGEVAFYKIYTLDKPGLKHLRGFKTTAQMTYLPTT